MNAPKLKKSHIRVWMRDSVPASIAPHSNPTERRAMHKLLARGHARLLIIGQRLRRPTSERGQGTVEYVGLVLLVSLLMVGMVASMKGFTGKQGTELAEVIINKIKQAVNAIKFS
jgi:hypothetical protein